MAITKDKFLKVMKFPKEWVEWGMWTDELSDIYVTTYEPEHEGATEHTRNGAFHWWLRKDPTKEELIKLIKLTFLEPERGVANDIRSYIGKAKSSRGGKLTHVDDDIIAILNSGKTSDSR